MDNLPNRQQLAVLPAHKHELLVDGAGACVLLADGDAHGVGEEARGELLDEGAHRGAEEGALHVAGGALGEDLVHLREEGGAHALGTGLRGAWKIKRTTQSADQCDKREAQWFL